MRPRTSRLMAALVRCSALVLALPSVVSQATAQDKTPHPIAVALPARPPAGAVVLFCGKADEITANWVKRGSKDPAPWVAEADGCMSPRAGDITSEAEFGDCYIHLEFRATVDDQGRTRGHGNAGVGLQGRYEIQIMDSFGVAPEAHGCGSMYSQKAPRVNACKKPGEWQTFDIIFRAPRLNDDGAVTEKARATVFQNGILILNNEDFAGPTGIQYGEFRGEAKTGPIVLQGDHDPVQFRNIWVAPL